MAFHFGLIKYLLLLTLFQPAVFGPAPASRSSNDYQQDRASKFVEIKLPVKITSADDLVAWAKNAMRSMASRIDITLASVDEPVVDKHKRVNTLEPRTKQREPLALSFDSRNPDASSAVLSTFANLLNPDSIFDSVIENTNDLQRDILPYGNVNAYLPVLLDDLELSRYREEALRKYYVEKEKAIKREKNRIENKDKKKSNKYTPAISQQAANVRIGNSDVKLPLVKNKDSENLTPVISVPFEAVVTITRENVPEPTRNNYEETRDPPDEFPPYFEKEYPRREIPGKPEFATKPKKNKNTSEKRQLNSLGDLLRMLGLTKRGATTTKKSTSNQTTKKSKGTKGTTTKSRPRKPSEKFTPPPLIQFEDEPPRPRRNQTSQRQELDDEDDDDDDDNDDEEDDDNNNNNNGDDDDGDDSTRDDDDDDESSEESSEEEGSLGSLADLIPLIIPILEDLSDPESDADLLEVIEAALPLFEGLFGNDPDSPNILAMLGPIVETIIGGKDGMGSDVGALLGPLLQLVGPLIGPLSGPLSGASSGGGGGSTVASLISAFVAPLTQPGPDGVSPISAITATIVSRLSKDLRIGQPGGLDIGALVAAVLSGTSAGLSGPLSDKKPRPGAYGPPPPNPPYGQGPVQAGSINTGTSTGFNSQANSRPHKYSHNHQPISGPINSVNYHGNVHRTTQKPYTTLPQRFQTHPPPLHHTQLQDFIQHHGTGPVPAGSSNMGDSSYLPYGNNNAVPAGSVNPLGLVGSSIKDILGGGVNLVSSLIGAVFGISGASSADKPAPAYGPPPQQGYH